MTAPEQGGAVFSCPDFHAKGGERMSKRMEQLLEKQKKLLEKKQQAEAEEKAVQKQIKELTRSERTHRLCSRGGYLEKLLETLGATELTDEEVFGYLDYALNTPYAKKALEKLLENKRMAAAKAEGTEAVESVD